jgi:hypothetical protein
VTGIRIVPDPLVFPHYDEYADEKTIAVTPGQVIRIVIGSGRVFDWVVPSGVARVNAAVFGP